LPDYFVRLKFQSSKYFNVFLRLKFSPSLYLDKIGCSSKVSKYGVDTHSTKGEFGNQDGFNQKNSSKLFFGIRIQNLESTWWIKISSKKF